MIHCPVTYEHGGTVVNVAVTVDGKVCWWVGRDIHCPLMFEHCGVTINGKVGGCYSDCASDHDMQVLDMYK